MGLSPHEIVFGRPRSLPGLPYVPDRECESAAEFLDRMGRLDAQLSQALNALHARRAESTRVGRTPERDYQLQDLVWVLRPPILGTEKRLTSRWRGPWQIVQRVGEHSFILMTPEGDFRGVHDSQMKPYQGDPYGEEGELLSFRKDEEAVPARRAKKLGELRGHRRNTWGEWEFLTHWEGDPDSETAWEPARTFMRQGTPQWLAYCLRHGLEFSEEDVAGMEVVVLEEH
jgi:hypothetical protein